MDFIKTNFSYLELTYKSTLNPKRKFKTIIQSSDIIKILFRKGYFEISNYDGLGVELYELESIIVK